MILAFMKGKTTFTELLDMPHRYLQTLYYKAYQEAVARMKDQKDGKVNESDVEDAMEELVDG